jgi:antitoxin MazE
MRATIVRIGNSQGIRIPKLLLERSGLGEEVDIEAREDQIVIRPLRRPRDGWSDAFQEMAQAGEDQLVDGDLPGQSSFDQGEWTW